VAFLLATGCGAVDPSASWKRVQGLAPPPYGETLRWQRTDEDAVEIDRAVRAALVPGLTRADAVRLALLGNPNLQATFEDVGIAQADLVQAGLFTNPSLAAFVAFPLATGNSAATLLGFLSDLWVVPARESVAEAERDAALRRVAAAVVATAAEAANAYDDVLYHRALLEVETANRDVRTQTLRRKREPTGNQLADELAAARMEAEMVEQDLAVAHAENQLVAARLHLAGMLGLPDDALLPRLDTALDVPPAEDWSVESAVPFALVHRLDVAAARLAVEKAERQVALQHRQTLGTVQVGPGYTGGLGTEDSGGPALQMTVPLFDQNRAQIAKAEHHLRKRRKQLRALEHRVRREIATALADIRFYARHVEIYRTRLAPLQQHAVEHAEQLGRTSDDFVLHGLEAREEEIEGRRGYLSAMRQLLQARQRLHRALWAGGSDA